MINKKGFTLVEVLAVIILLGVIAAIIIPNYNKSVENSKKKAFEESLNGLVRTIENYIANTPNTTVYTTTYTDVSAVDLQADNLNQIKSGQFIITNDIIVLRNVYNGRYCGNGSKNNFTIVKGTC